MNYKDVNWWENEWVPGQKLSPEQHEALYELLGIDDWNIRNTLEKWLGQHYDEQLLPTLFRALGDGDNANRRNTAYSILTAYGRSIIPHLKKYFRAQDDDLRLYTVMLAGQICALELLPYLFESLKDSNPNVVVAAIEALGRLGSTEAVQPLIEFLETGDDWVRFQAILALGEIGHPEGWKKIQNYLDDPFMKHAVLQSLGGYLSREALITACTSLLNELQKESILSSTLRWFVVPLSSMNLHTYALHFQNWLDELLAQTENLHFSQLPWHEWLMSSVDSIHESALYWGLFLGIDEVVQHFIHLLREPKVFGKILSMISWINISHEDVWLELWKNSMTPEFYLPLLLRVSPFLSSEQVLWAIIGRWEEFDIETAQAWLNIAFQSVSVPNHFKKIIWLTAWESMQSSYLENLLDVLNELGKDFVQELLEDSDQYLISENPAKRSLYWVALAFLHPEQFFERFKDGFNDPHPWVRYVIALLGHRTFQDTMLQSDLFQAAFTDEHPAIRQFAVQYCPDSVENCIEILLSMLHDEEHWVRVATVERLCKIGQGNIFSILQKEYFEQDFPTKLEICKQIGKIDTHEVLLFYKTMFPKSDGPVQQAIVEGMSFLKNHKNEAIETLLQWYGSLSSPPLEIRILESFAQLDPYRFVEWAQENQYILESKYRLFEILSLFRFYPESELPKWVQSWLYHPTTYPTWIELIEKRPDWKQWIKENGPYRLVRIVELLFDESGKW